MPFKIEKTIEERFWSKVEKTDDCWLWKAYILKNGYGQFRIDNRTLIVAHRYSYILTKGEIGAGLDLDHLCRVRHCVNPAHLEPVTRQENIVRGNVILKKKSGLPLGVSEYKGFYVVQKTLNGQRTYLGSFKTPQEAAESYLLA